MKKCVLKLIPVLPPPGICRNRCRQTGNLILVQMSGDCDSEKWAVGAKVIRQDFKSWSLVWTNGSSVGEYFRNSITKPSLHHPVGCSGLETFFFCMHVCSAIHIEMRWFVKSLSRLDVCVHLVIMSQLELVLDEFRKENEWNITCSLLCDQRYYVVNADLRLGKPVLDWTYCISLFKNKIFNFLRNFFLNILHNQWIS